MPAPVPASTLLDKPQQLLAVLGSFWTRTYTAQDQLASYAGACLQLASQAYLNTLETLACVSRYTVPIFHTENWYLLGLRESQANQANQRLPQFDDPDLFFDGHHQFDTPELVDSYTFPVPAELVSAPAAMNRITNPSVLLHQGADYTINTEKHTITFTQNPFDNPLFARRPVFENGILVDNELAVWLFKGQFDYEHIYRHFGYVLGLKLASSEGYRDLLNALMDCLVGGTTSQRIDAALQAITGIPLVQEQEEAVAAAIRDGGHTLIITDKHTYQFPDNVTPVVSVGDIIHAGDAMVEGLQIYEFNRGETPANLQALALGPGFLSACFYGELIFENVELPLEVDTNHPSGYTYLSFGLGGFPADVQQFFDEMHARGIVEAEKPVDSCHPGRLRGTLAHLLDKRGNKLGEPQPQHLPSTINPLKFLIENVLRNNVFLVWIKTAALGAGRVGLYNLKHLRRYIPPHTAMLVLIELGAQHDEIKASDQVIDRLDRFQAMTPQHDIVVGQIREKMGIKLISGTYQ